MFILYPEKVLTTKSAPQESGADNGIFYSKYIYQSTRGIITLAYDNKTLKDNKIYYSNFNFNTGCDLSLTRDLWRDMWRDILFGDKLTCITLDEFKNMVGIKDLTIENSYILYCPETGDKFHIGDEMILRSNTHILQDRHYIFDEANFPRFEQSIPESMADFGPVQFIDTCAIKLRDIDNENGEHVVLIKRGCCEEEFNDIGYCTFFDDYTGSRLRNFTEKMRETLLKSGGRLKLS